MTELQSDPQTALSAEQVQPAPPQPEVFIKTRVNCTLNDGTIVSEDLEIMAPANTPAEKIAAWTAGQISAGGGLLKKMDDGFRFFPLASIRYFDVQPKVAVPSGVRVKH